MVLPPAGDPEHKGTGLGHAGTEEIRWHLPLFDLAWRPMAGRCSGRPTAHYRWSSCVLSCTKQQGLLGPPAGEGLRKVSGWWKALWEIVLDGLKYLGEKTGSTQSTTQSVGPELSPHHRVWAQNSVHTTECGPRTQSTPLSVGPELSPHHRVWAQNSVHTTECGPRTQFTPQSVGPELSSHHRVWAQNSVHTTECGPRTQSTPQSVGPELSPHH